MANDMGETPPPSAMIGILTLIGFVLALIATSLFCGLLIGMAWQTVSGDPLAWSDIQSLLGITVGVVILLGIIIFFPEEP